MTQRVTGFIGKSGSGKTTLIETLARRAVARGRSVAAIKHTHHAVAATRRGDTERLIAAGAEPVILCSDEAAIRFTRGEAAALNDVRVETLLRSLDTELVFIEGFKNIGDWPRLLFAGDETIEVPPHVVAVIGSSAAASALLPALPHFAREDTANIALFLDRITGP
jgi:molybdopterin-guanine dinucleotide biosynthesis protein MobB